VIEIHRLRHTTRLVVIREEIVLLDPVIFPITIITTAKTGNCHQRGQAKKCVGCGILLEHDMVFVCPPSQFSLHKIDSQHHEPESH